MNRLTRRGKKNKDWVLLNKRCSKYDGDFCPHAETCDFVDKRTCPYLEALDRLAAYEDTGLEPDEIRKMQSELDRLQAVLTEQKEHFVVALAALREKTERSKGCEYCLSRFGIAAHHVNQAGMQTGTKINANFCPVCGAFLQGVRGNK